MADAFMRELAEQLRWRISAAFARRTRDEDLAYYRTIRMARDGIGDTPADAADHRRGGRPAAHQPSCDLRDDRAAPAARHRAHSSPRPGPQRRPARLAAPE